MSFNVSTTAFDTVVENSPTLSVWTARGFVSPTWCGFDLNVASDGNLTTELSQFWELFHWLHVPEFDPELPVALLIDRSAVQLTVAASGTGVPQYRAKTLALFTAIFPPPPRCTSLVLAVDDSPSGPQSFRLDHDEFNASLARWQRSRPTADS